MALLIDVYDDPETLLRELDASAVFPSGLALEGFLHHQGGPLLGSRPRVLRELWQDLGDREPSGDLFFQEVLREEIKNMPLLCVLQDKDLGELQSHLDRIANEVCGEINPQTELEAEMRELITRMRKRGVFSEASWRLEIALRASEIRTDPLLLAPVPGPSRQFGMLLSGLAEKNEVRLLLLLSREMIDPYLRSAGLEGKVQTHFTRQGAVPWGEAGESDRIIHIWESSDPGAAEDALRGQGAIVSPSPFRDWRKLWPDTKMLFRADFSARETPLGSRMLRATREEEDWQSIEAGSSERDLLWEEALVREQELLRDLPVDPTLLLEKVYSRRLWRGQGPRLLAPGEVPLQAPRKLVFWGLDADKYPLPESPSPFFSEALLQKHPELRGKDKRPTFVSALLAARQEIFLLHSGSPSSFLLECQRVWNLSSASWQDHRKRLRDLARQGPCTPRLQEIESRWKEPDPEPPHGRRYSVTELEAFLRCPLGWFVRYRIRPQSTPSPEQELGLRLHRVLENLYELPESERLESLPEMLGDDLPEWQSRIEKVLERYSNLLPGAQHILENPLEAEIPFEDGEVVLRGRADRIDFSEEGVLLVDWKTSSLPRMEPENLQAALYPWLAAKRLQVEPLGFLYVSLRSGESRGLTSRPLVRDIDSGWRSFSGRAMQKAGEAISRIEAGEWKETGKRCQNWCPHHLLSQTGVRLG